MTDIWCPSCRKRICVIELTEQLKDKLMNCSKCGTEFVFAKFGECKK
jgi:hypothetical protein